MGYVDAIGNPAPGEKWSSGVADGQGAHSNKTAVRTTANTTLGWSECDCPGGDTKWRRGIVLDEHFREIACESEAPLEPPPEPAAAAAHRPADPVAAASSGPFEWIAVGATSLLGAVLVLLLTRRRRRPA